MLQKKFYISNRNLPHWKLKGATYFITFNTKESTLSKQEQKLVLQHIKNGNNKYYNLYAAVVMPDHVHLILLPNNTYDLAQILKGIKGASARKINQKRKSSGPIWMQESYDRIIRDENEFLEKMNYIVNNPVKKGLADNPLKYHGLYICND